ncbi:MAG: PPOX class F420-dependent oxidoreductase [Proteobacteria bacterium]|nr:PPOX class F420-dependent oxidoreductase [Pseudomonadota bacterium]
MPTIPETHVPILQTKAVAALALVKADGSPQVTPMWFKHEGDFIIFNTARGRVKDKILARMPKVAVAVVDPENSYRYVQIQGEVVEGTEEGANDVIDSLALKYLGQPKYPFGQPGEVRVTYKVRIDRVQTMG